MWQFLWQYLLTHLAINKNTLVFPTASLLKAISVIVYLLVTSFKLRLEKVGQSLTRIKHLKQTSDIYDWQISLQKVWAAHPYIVMVLVLSNLFLQHAPHTRVCKHRCLCIYCQVNFTRCIIVVAVCKASKFSVLLTLSESNPFSQY